MTIHKCAKCGGAMEEGFIVDDTYGGRVQSQWAEGKPQRSIWTGLKIAKESKHPVMTYRCKKCGYLESFAPNA